VKARLLLPEDVLMIDSPSPGRALGANLLSLVTMLGALACGCGRPDTAVVLSLFVAPAAPVPDYLKIQSFDPFGEAFGEGVFTPRSVSSGGWLGTVVVYPTQPQVNSLRLHARAVNGEAVSAQAVVAIAFQPSRRVLVQLLLHGRAMPDRDLDSVPDEIDNCPALVNPRQEDREGDGLGDACSGGTAGKPTGTVDAGTPPPPPPDAPPFDRDGANASPVPTGMTIGANPVPASTVPPVASPGSPALPPPPAPAVPPASPPAAPADAGVADARAPRGPPMAEVCDIRRPVKIGGRRASASGDLTFDDDGFLVLPEQGDIIRLSAGGSAMTIVENALAPGRILYGVRVLSVGRVLFTDNASNDVFLEDARRQRRAFEMNAPIQFVRGPTGHIYVTGAGGELFQLDVESGQTRVVARTGRSLRGLTLSADKRSLYVSDRESRALLRAELREAGTVGPFSVVTSDLGGAPDGLATDRCGNVYIADRSGAPLLRVTLAGQVEIVSDDTGDLSALAFGSGRQGWDERTLYAISEERDGLVEIEIGVRGALLP
jgi:sugar lactone lactonase YvrE